MSIIPKQIDKKMRSYSDRVVPNENWHIFEETDRFLGHARLVDLNSILNGKPDTMARVRAIQALGVQDPYAKAIVSDNNSLKSLAWRTLRDNRREWHKDVAYAKGKQKNRKAQSDPVTMSEFKAKRMWLGCIGDQRENAMGNRMIRVDKQGNLSIFI